MVARIDKFLDATSKIRVQKTKYRCDGDFGIKVCFENQPFDYSTYEEIIYSFLLLGRFRELVIPEASYDPDFEMLPAVHPNGA